MKNIDRRTFLKNSAAVGIGLAATNIVRGGGIVSSAKTTRDIGRDSYLLSRSIPVEDRYDILVCGGGPSGIAAALSAARLGAKVLLIEATGCLGGMATSGLVSAFPRIGDGKNLMAGGILWEIIEKMHKRGGLGPGMEPEKYAQPPYCWIPFSAEEYKLLLDDLMIEAGVEVRFFTNLIDVDASIEDGVVNGAIIHNIDGYSFIHAKKYIDCTGDATLSSMSGVECREAGRDTEGIMPASILQYVGNIDFSTIKGGSRYLQRAVDDGFFTQPEYSLTGLYRAGKSYGALNAGHVFNLDALRNKSVSNGMMTGRKVAHEFFEFYKKYVPGYENAEQLATSALMGVRESRRIVGEYELCYNDLKTLRVFPDQICVFRYHIDIHPYVADPNVKNTTSSKTIKKFADGEHFGIPYSALVPKGWKNLWVAGRSISTDILANGSIRVQPVCIMMGEAAGAAAYLSLKRKADASQLNMKELITTLRNQGANLPQPMTGINMTIK